MVVGENRGLLRMARDLANGGAMSRLQNYVFWFTSINSRRHVFQSFLHFRYYYALNYKIILDATRGESNTIQIGLNAKDTNPFIEADARLDVIIHSFPVFSRIVLIISLPTLVASGNLGAKYC
jgi:hypothetical protein